MTKKGFTVIKDLDKGMKKIVNELRFTDKIDITAGVHSEDGLESKEGSKSVNVAQVALTHEFGVPDKNIPNRSFLRDAFDSDRVFHEGLMGLINGLLFRRAGLKTSAGLLALGIQKAIKSRILRGIPPALKPETVKRKGSSKPLINTGQLLRAIKAKVFNS